MRDPIEAVLNAAKLETSVFPVTSRYYGVATATIETAEDKTVVYLRRRFIPRQERFELIQEHTVVQGDRIDNIAAAYLGDPEQFWRIADANGAMHPGDLTQTVARQLRITPEFVQAFLLCDFVHFSLPSSAPATGIRQFPKTRNCCANSASYGNLLTQRLRP